MEIDDLKKEYTVCLDAQNNILIRPTENKNPKLIVNFLHYFESINFHTYFNSKLFINNNGQLSNNPYSFDNQKEMGNMFTRVELLQLIQSDSFKELSVIKKDNMAICKSCEFRYMCVDKRLPILSNYGDWYHKKECDYNPYIGKWKNEEGYRKLSESGVISDENSFSIDHNRIASINEELWGEG
jgi:radical SAM protein with 4Fe4S-binding SPASM domain